MRPRRVVVLSYYFPPTPSIGGVRAAGLAKFLPEYGWQAVVVTPRRPGRDKMTVQLVETADADLAATAKRLLGLPIDSAFKDAVSRSVAPTAGSGLKRQLIELFKSVAAIPDTNRGWIRIADRAGKEQLDVGRVDVILSTSPPPSVHVAASRLARRSGVPWVADLRDLWSDDRNSQAPWWRRRIDRRFEQRTLRGASALVTVSEPLAEELRRLHPEPPCYAVATGYDPDLVGIGGPLSRQFTLVHTGTFYQGRRDPTLLMQTVGRLLDDGRIPRHRLRIRLFARGEPWLAALAERHGVSDVVEFIPWGPREQALRAQQEAQVLLLLHWGAEREAGVYTGKVFEYLAARRPILMIGGGSGVLHDLLERTAAGVHVTDAAQLERQLVSWWREFEHEGAVSWRGRPAEIERYTQRRMAQRYAEILDTAVSGRREPS